MSAVYAPATDEEKSQAIERTMNPGASRRINGGARATASSARLFVGNLDFGTGEDELRELFSTTGFEVVETRIVTDRQTGEPRGFAFVELQTNDDAANAIEQLDGTTFRGRPLRINAADRRKR